MKIEAKQEKTVTEGWNSNKSLGGNHEFTQVDL